MPTKIAENKLDKSKVEEGREEKEVVVGLEGCDRGSL